jgi:hypothetical protein
MKTYGVVDVLNHDFFTSTLIRGEWSASCHGRFTPEERTLGSCCYRLQSRSGRNGKVTILDLTGTRTLTRAHQTHTESISWVLSRVQSGQRVKQTAELHIVPR